MSVLYGYVSSEVHLPLLPQCVWKWQSSDMHKMLYVLLLFCSSVLFTLIESVNARIFWAISNNPLMDNTVTTGAGSWVTSGLKVLKYLFWCIICPLVHFFSPFRGRTLTLGPRGVRLREVRLVFHIFRILEYSVYSAIPFCQSVSAPFLQIWSPPCLPIFRNVTEIVKNMVWGDAVPKLQTFVWIFNHASSPRGFKNHKLIPVQP